MRKATAVVAAVAAFVALVTLAGTLGACSLPFGADEASSPTPTGSTIERILGHAPTGLAEKIARAGQISVATDADYPPQSYLKDGELVGFDVDVAKRVAELLGVEVKFVNPSWSAVPTGLRAKKYDVSIGSMTPSSAPDTRLAFADPYYYTQAQLMVKRGTAPLATVEDLKGKTVGCGAATTYQDFLMGVGGVDVRTYDSGLQAVRDVARGRLDAALTDDVTANHAIAKGRPVDLSGQPFFYEPASFAVRKGERDLLALLDYAVKTMREDGSLSTMSQAWYEGRDLTQAPAAGVPEFGQVVAQLTGQ